MIETLILVAVGIVVVLAIVLFAFAKAGGPLAVETRGQLELVRRRMKDPVSATLQVTGISEPSFDGTDCTGQLTGVVSGDGIQPQAVQRKGMIRIARWPSVGQQLPIVIDRANPKLFFIDQTNLSTGADALDEAERLAAAMKAGTD